MCAQSVGLPLNDGGADGVGDVRIHRNVHTRCARLIALCDGAGIVGVGCWGYCDGGGS